MRVCVYVCVVSDSSETKKLARLLFIINEERPKRWIHSRTSHLWYCTQRQNKITISLLKVILRLPLVTADIFHVISTIFVVIILSSLPLLCFVLFCYKYEAYIYKIVYANIHFFPLFSFAVFAHLPFECEEIDLFVTKTDCIMYSSLQNASGWNWNCSTKKISSQIESIFGNQRERHEWVLWTEFFWMGGHRKCNLSDMRRYLGIASHPFISFSAEKIVRYRNVHLRAFLFSSYFSQTIMR